jgi:hypothetical protein
METEAFETEEWQTRAKTIANNRTRMIKERDRLRKLQGLTARKLKDAKGPEKEYLEVFGRQTQVFLDQFAHYPLDTNVVNPIEAGSLLALEFLTIESQLLHLRLNALNLAQLHRVLSADFKAACEGAPPVGNPPEVWKGARAQLATSEEWRGSVQAFLDGYSEFTEALKALVDAFAGLDVYPAGPARLKAAKELNVPGVKGMHYRLEALFRKLPGGDAVLEGTRFYLFEPAAFAAEPEPEPAAAVSGKKLTDRLFKLFGK